MGKVEILSSDRAKVFGDPTIRGITSEVILDAELEMWGGNARRALALEAFSTQPNRGRTKKEENDDTTNTSCGSHH